MSNLLPADYAHWLANLKTRIRTARLKASLAVNSELVQLYWHIGAEIMQRQNSQGWGKKVAEQIAEDLRAELPNMKGLSPRNLNYTLAFAQAWPDESILQQLVAKLPWGHNVRLLEMVKDRQVREWYIHKTLDNGWSRSVLEAQIESQLHLRLGTAQTNFARTLPAPQSDLAREVLP